MGKEELAGVCQAGDKARFIQKVLVEHVLSTKQHAESRLIRSKGKDQETRCDDRKNGAGRLPEV